MTHDMFVLHVSLFRAVNGLQNFEGFLEFFELGSSVENATCTETSHLTEGNRLILVRYI